MEYGLRMYATMLGDKARVSSYSQALARVVRPGCTVVDLGAGFGYFSLLACKLGARHVYAIEPAESILVGKELAEANGCADRITFIRDVSTAVTLPERADVLVCDLRGATPMYAQSLASIIDARSRLLKPNGVLLPRRDTLFVAPVEDRATYVDACRPWQGAAADGLDLSLVERKLVHEPTKSTCSRNTFLAAPRSWATLDYATLESPHVTGHVELDIEQSGTLHGFIAWFEAEIAEGIGYSTGPDVRWTTYSRFFFPIAKPAHVQADDRVKLTISAECTSDDYVWIWRLAVQRGSEIIARCEQSSFEAGALELAKLKRSAPAFAPTLNDAGVAEVYMLNAFGSGRPLEAIANDAHERFPKVFPSMESALTKVAQLSVRYSR